MDRPAPARLDAVYGAASAEAQEGAYDAWASDYDADLMAMGYRLPMMMAACVARFVPVDAAPILDAGCGTGLHAEALVAAGYGGLVGADLSEGMMAVARAKGVYAETHRVVLGTPLPFADGHFAATLCAGTITPGHAPPEALDELVRVTRPGGWLVVSLRHDAEQEARYLDKLDAMAGTAWDEVHRTPAFATMPLGEPSVRNRVHVCRVR
ncbi:class I SAM-dependent methyltransferase [Jannaschia sp. Os4]|uniref:class I SAM-dependent DNA methyltransferase n=1 Tax=Jannaschia sp. Os4 TaxID=2807617 RepID=UPI001939934E|nr:class I SAM-dependent methyltransferase [Jannaschia sp. Os4]MBM2577648.1 class I SAM-dependent methyltransferase [Jannaschia sp. Os4]